MNRPVHAASLASIALFVAACGAPTGTTGDAAPESATTHDAAVARDVVVGDDSAMMPSDAAGSDDVAPDAGSLPDVVAERDVATDTMTTHDGGGACVSDKLVPTCGGVWWGAAPGSTALAAYETALGRSLDIVHSYHVDAQAFPTSEETAQSASGHLLLINWKPSSAVNGWHIAATARSTRRSAPRPTASRPSATRCSWRSSTSPRTTCRAARTRSRARPRTTSRCGTTSVASSTHTTSPTWSGSGT